MVAGWKNRGLTERLAAVGAGRLVKFVAMSIQQYQNSEIFLDTSNALCFERVANAFRMAQRWEIDCKGFGLIANKTRMSIHRDSECLDWWGSRNP
jgi:hypothetical protein